MINSKKVTFVVISKVNCILIKSIWTHLKTYIEIIVFKGLLDLLSAFE